MVGNSEKNPKSVMRAVTSRGEVTVKAESPLPVFQPAAYLFGVMLPVFWTSITFGVKGI